MKKSILLILSVWVAAATVAKAQTASFENTNQRRLQNIEWESIFEPAPKFEKGSWILQIGIGFRNDTKITEFTNQVTLPALSMTLEKAIGKNFGFGMTAGVQMWKADLYNYPYRQFNLGLRASYHLNIGEKFEPYAALAGVVRYMDVRADDYYNYKFKVAPGFLVGARYYVSPRVGLFGEIGNETLTWFRLGTCLKLK